MAQSKLRRRALERMAQDHRQNEPSTSTSTSASASHGSAFEGLKPLRLKLPVSMSREELQRYKQMAVIKERQKRRAAKMRIGKDEENVSTNRPEMSLSGRKGESVFTQKQKAAGIKMKQKQRSSAVLKETDRRDVLLAKEEAIRREKERKVRVSKLPIPATKLTGSNRTSRAAPAKKMSQLGRKVAAKSAYTKAELYEYKLEAIRKEEKRGKRTRLSGVEKRNTKPGTRPTDKAWMDRLHQVFLKIQDDNGSVSLTDLRQVLEDASQSLPKSEVETSWITLSLAHLSQLTSAECQWADVVLLRKRLSRNKRTDLSSKEKHRKGQGLLLLCRAGYAGLAQRSSVVLPKDLDDVLKESLENNIDLLPLIDGMELPYVAPTLPSTHITSEAYERRVCELLNIEEKQKPVSRVTRKTAVEETKEQSVQVQTDAVELQAVPPVPPANRRHRGTQCSPASEDANEPVARPVDSKEVSTDAAKTEQSSATARTCATSTQEDLAVVDAAIRSLKSEISKMDSSSDPIEGQKMESSNAQHTSEGEVYKGRCWLCSQDFATSAKRRAVCAEVTVLQATSPFRLYIRVVLDKNGQESVRRIGIEELTRLAKESAKQLQGSRPLISAMRSACSEATVMLTNPERSRLRQAGVDKWSPEQLERAIAAEESIREWVESGRIPEQNALVQWLLLHCVVCYDPEDEHRRMKIILPGDIDIGTDDKGCIPNRVGANILSQPSGSPTQGHSFESALKLLRNGMEKVITDRQAKDQRNALIIAHNSLGVTSKRTISVNGFRELVKHFCGEVNNSATAAISKKFRDEETGMVNLHELFFEVMDVNAFLETWRRSVKGWKAWEINDAFQDYDPNKSGHISLASFVSVLKEEMLMEVPYWQLVVLHYQFIVKGNLMSYRKFIKYIVKRLSQEAEV